MVSSCSWAVVPTLLYYLGIFLAIEIDSRKIEVDYRPPPGLRAWPILKRGFYHFISLGIIVVFLSIGMAPFKAVVYATLVGIGFGIIEIVLSRLGEPKSILQSSLGRLLRCAVIGYPFGPAGNQRMCGRGHHRLDDHEDRPRSGHLRHPHQGRPGDCRQIRLRS